MVTLKICWAQKETSYASMIRDGTTDAMDM